MPDLEKIAEDLSALSVALTDLWVSVEYGLCLLHSHYARYLEVQYLCPDGKETMW